MARAYELPQPQSQDRAQRAMADAAAAGVTAFERREAKIVDRRGSLLLVVGIYPDTPIVAEVAEWTGTATGDNEELIRICQWLNAHY